MPVRHDEHSWLLLIWILRSSHFLQRFATLHSKSAISWRSEPSLEELCILPIQADNLHLFDPLSQRPLFPETEKLPKSHPAWWWGVILASFGSCAQALGKNDRGAGVVVTRSQEGKSPGQSLIWSHWILSPFIRGVPLQVRSVDGKAEVVRDLTWGKWKME